MNTALFPLSCPSYLLLSQQVHGKKKERNKRKKNCQGTLRGEKIRKKIPSKWVEMDQERREVWTCTKRTNLYFDKEFNYLHGSGASYCAGREKRGEKITDANVSNIENRQCGVRVGGVESGVSAGLGRDVNVWGFFATGGSVETISLAPRACRRGNSFPLAGDKRGNSLLLGKMTKDTVARAYWGKVGRGGAWRGAGG